MKRLFAFITIAFLCFDFAHLVNASGSISTLSDNSCTLRVSKKGEGCFLYKVEAGDFSISVYYYLPNQLQANTKSAKEPNEYCQYYYPNFFSKKCIIFSYN